MNFAEFGISLSRSHWPGGLLVHITLSDDIDSTNIFNSGHKTALGSINETEYRYLTGILCLGASFVLSLIDFVRPKSDKRNIVGSVPDFSESSSSTNI